MTRGYGARGIAWAVPWAGREPTAATRRKQELRLVPTVRTVVWLGPYPRQQVWGATVGPSEASVSPGGRAHVTLDVGLPPQALLLLTI